MTTDLRTSGTDGARRAERARASTPDVRGASRRFDEALAAARREGRGAPGGPGIRHARRNPPTPGQAEAAHHDAAPDLPRAAASLPRGAPGSVAAADAAAPPAAALRAAVRSLPAAVEAARLHDGVQVALALGGALGVDLRGGAGGVELTLRPAAPLGPAAAAELPALVAALRARGVRVTRAEVRGEPGARRPPGPPARQAR